MIDDLNDENFLLYAVKHYNNPSCSGMKEFQDDLKRFKYIKRLLRRYSKTTKITNQDGLFLSSFVRMS